MVGRTLVFLAVNHVPGAAALDTPDLTVVKHAIERARPGSLLVEIQTGGQFPSSAFASIGANCLREGQFSCGEGAYGAYLAGTAGAKVWGGEPSPSQLNAALERTVESESLAAYASVQALINLKFLGVPLDSWDASFTREFSRVSMGASGWTYDRFRKWLKNNLETELSQVALSWIEPRNDKDASALEKIAHKVDGAREPLIQRALETVINGASTSMAIYGSGHFYKQSPALEAVFGRPKIRCLSQPRR